jgi:3',5'-cyclic AMP phosphodiesterase CpdA
MRTLVHLSDLHFGRIDHQIIRPLIERVTHLAPHVVAVSGDLTQRARSEQFKAAREFLDALPAPRIVVPGNHDVPLHNVFRRMLQPLDNYRRYITGDLQPFHADDEIAVIGINTARSLTIKHGRVNEAQLAAVRERLSSVGSRIVKIIVTHHPFDLPESHGDRHLVGRARAAMNTFARHGVDVLLSGHLHIGHTGNTAARYEMAGGRSALVVQAGTATSTRARGEANSFNVLRIDGGSITVERHLWKPALGQFTAGPAEHFHLGAAGWTGSRVNATDVPSMPR